MENPFERHLTIEQLPRYVGLPKNDFEHPLSIEGRFGKIVCSTDAGLRPRNEDALAINTDRSCFADIDGLGAEEHPDRAARILSEDLLACFAQDIGPRCEDFAEAVNVKTLETQRRFHDERADGACFLAMRMTPHELQYCQSGDVRLLLMHRKSDELLASEDEVTQDGKLWNALMKDRRRRITGRAFPLQADQRFLLASDGLWKFFSNQEVAQLVKTLPLEQALTVLDREWHRRMALNQKEADHRSIVIGDIDHL